ncbi:PREDICTED: amino acid transporter ANTL2-like [Rhagoletis zephyria]|uniref:amino acid transporter ANTL2-like n=1 Tax=Rhagoletis zephyria TaxID=28612 RepID=UPI0008118D6D|nr:PREDICTED: amino acid transporter ANTL2-like [Rhagoletis zephyria]
MSEKGFDMIATGKGFSVFTATAFIIGEVAGGGILSLPSATAGAGWSGLAMILYCATCAGISGMCLAKSWLILEERYPEYRQGLTRKPFSTIGAFVSVIMNITRIGASTVFVILSAGLAVALTSSFIHLTECQWIPIVVAVFLVPFWLGSPADFWPVAYLAMLSTVIGSILLITKIIMELSKNGPSTDYHIDGIKSYSAAFGTILFAFGGASAFPNFQNDMKEKTKFPIAVVFGFIGLILLYLPTAGLGYGTFGHSVKSSILKNLETGTFITVINSFFFIHCLTVVIIILNPVYLDMEELLRIPKQFNWKRCVFRTALLALILLIAETFPSFGEIVDLIGGSTVAIMAFVLPPIFYIKLCRDNSGDWPERSVSIYHYIVFGVIVLSGFVGGIASTYATISNWTPLSSACYLSHNSGNSTK